MNELSKNKMLPFSKSGNVYIVAEIANAAQGVVEDNYKLIESAKTVGADAVKLQLYKYDELTTPSYSKHDVYKRTFYSFKNRTKFIDYACKLGIDVWVDIFDRWALELAKANIDKITAIKIPPTIILDQELVEAILRLNLPTSIGVGGYEDEDVDFVLSRIQRFDNQILLMYGYQSYPTPEEHCSLARMTYLKDKYGYPLGYADHVDAQSDMALRMPEYALFAGASVIEKHIILDRKPKGLDHYSALEPDEFKMMVKNLRRCAVINGSKKITSTQKDYLEHATRITTVRSVNKGELLSRKDINFRRTDNTDALFPNEIGHLFPAVAVNDLRQDCGITKRDIKKPVCGVVAVCRMHSTRLQSKALLELGGSPVIDQCLTNTLASKISNMTILATSTHPDDQVLQNHTLNGKVKFFRGSETDVAERILEAAKINGLDIIVRVTGDSPLISYDLIDILLLSHLDNGADFSYFKDAPLGVRPEVISVSAIEKLKSLLDTTQYSEYLSLYFKNNPEHFNLNEVLAPEEFRFPQYRLNLDYPEDYELNKAVFNHLSEPGKPISLKKVIDFLRQNPDIAKINSAIQPKYTTGDFAEFINRITTITQKDGD